MKRLRFAVFYALHNLARDRQHTIFALFSVAAGVATVVALRMLGLMLTDALTSNVQGMLRGDVTVESFSGGFRISGLQNSSNNDVAFTNENIQQINAWAAQNHVDVTYSTTNDLMQTALVRDGQAGRPAFVMGYFIDPKTYPFYDTIKAEDPPGVPLASLLNGPDQVVVPRRVATELGVHVGDQIRLGTASALQTVKGIVPDTSESSFNALFKFLFSYIYIDRAYSQEFGLPAGAADIAYLRIPVNVDPNTVAQSIPDQWPRPLIACRRATFCWRVDTTSRLLQANSRLADLASRFMLLMSLVALVIGGVGIANTMIVSVNRRAPEIATLKTLGLKSGSVSLLFLVESVISSIIGSVLGLGIGLVLSLLARSFGEEAFSVTLPWRFSLDPLALGLGLGLVIAILFSILPTLIAAQVRPALVLRQGNVPLTRMGCLAGVFSLIVLLVGIGAMSQAIIGNAASGAFPTRPGPNTGFMSALANLPYGWIGTLVVFAIIVIILILIWIVVWLLGHLPSFQNPNLRIAVRALTQHRARTSLSLLALIIGMTALSGTLIMTRSLTMLLHSSISEPLGGNVIVLPLLSLTNGAVHARMDSAQGVSGYREVRIFRSSLVAINGDYSWDSHLLAPDDLNTKVAAGQLNALIGMRVHGSPPRGTLAAGRYLDDSDAGKYNLVVPNLPQLAPLGVHVGSTFTYDIGGQIHDFTVVGLIDPDPRTGLIPFSLGDSAVQAPLDVASGTLPFDLTIANVKPESINDVMASVGAVPGVFVFDLSVFDAIFNRLLTQMSALPILVSVLSLFAATVLIATTVSLATLERRRQIAILKALGVKRWQALNQLLLENGIVGLVGGIISLLPSLLIFAAAPLLSGGLVQLPVPIDLLAIMLFLSIAVTLAATFLTAWGASGEKPLQALRYE
ncbi:MAG TPA: FtsX-like permease family protein [Aggregatilineales bacterium]|nr:FtsX-like permease family protein [Aggregatilineales bacterium]